MWMWVMNRVSEWVSDWEGKRESLCKCVSEMDRDKNEWMWGINLHSAYDNLTSVLKWLHELDYSAASVCLSLSGCLSVCLSVRLYIWNIGSLGPCLLVTVLPSVCLSSCIVSVCMSHYLYISVSVCLSVFVCLFCPILSLRMSVFLSVHLYLPLYSCVCLSVCLYLYSTHACLSSFMYLLIYLSICLFIIAQS